MAEAVSQREYARRKGWEPSYVNKLVKQGKIPRDPQGRVDPAAADAALEQIRMQVRNNPGSTSLLDAQVRNLLSQADLREFKLEKDRGKYAAIADVKRLMQSCNAVVRTRLLTIPNKMPPLLVGRTAVQIKALLDDEIRAALIELANPENYYTPEERRDVAREKAGARYPAPHHETGRAHLHTAETAE